MKTNILTGGSGEQMRVISLDPSIVPIEPRIRPSRKLRGGLIGASVLLTSMIIYALYGWWISPEHRINQFVAAHQHGNTAAMLSIANSAELQHLGLTPGKLNNILNDAAGTPTGLHLGEITEEPLNNHQRGFNRLVNVPLFDATGKQLPGYKGAPAVAYVYAVNSDEGWQIGISHFINAIVYQRYHYTHVSYADLCVRYHMPLEMYDPVRGEWRMVALPTR